MLHVTQSMYSKLPSLVIGFHGCDASVASAVLQDGEALHASTNDYDWLGSGVYFWEQNYARALSWAQEQASRGVVTEPAVVGAVLDLGHCLNLTDSYYIDLVEKEYELLANDLELADVPLPKNSGKTTDKLFRRLDCAVINHLHARIETTDEDPSALYFEPFDSVRGLFSEGDPIYEGAGLKRKTHVQICVRNPNCIKGYFKPRLRDRDWLVP